jgi:hypothetical protein
VILAYPLRLLCLCLATFFLAHLLLGFLVSLLAPAAIRMGRRVRSDQAARLLLGLRLLPALGSLFLVAAVCAPSYLRFEPRGSEEEAGLLCLTAASMAAAIWATSLPRAISAAIRSIRFVRHCQRIGRQTQFPGESTPAWVVEGASGLLVATGIVRHRLFISQAVLDVLSPEQLSAALRHERAHGASHDNLKRMLLLLTPDVVPFSKRFAQLERAWMRFAEWAADDDAVAGDSVRSVSLAAALVRVARLRPAPRSSLLFTALLDEGRDLSARVERLLASEPAAYRSGATVSMVAASGALLTAASAAAVMLDPETLRSAHRVFEQFMR